MTGEDLTPSGTVDFRQIVHEDTDALVVYDRDFCFLYLNREAERLLQRTLDDLRGKHAWDEFPEAVGLPAHEAQARAMRERVPLAFEAEYAPLGIVFEARCQPYGGPDGGLTVRWHDIRERRRAEASEAALRTSQDALNFALDAARLGAWEQDIPGDRTFLSAPVGPMFGRPATAATLGWAEFLTWLHPEDRPALEDAYRAALHGPSGRLDIVHRALWPDGETVRWVHCQGSVTRRPDTGEPLRTAGVCRDVTEEREAADALRQSEERLRLAMSAAGLGEWVLDPETDTVSLSGRVAEMLGLPPEPRVVSLDRWDDWLHPDDLPRAAATLRAALKGNRRDYTNEYRVVLPGGKIRYIHTRAAVQRDASGRVVRLLGVSRDVTAERETQQARDALAERQRRLLRDMLYSTTDGRLCLCESPKDLPELVEVAGPPLDLDPRTVRRLRADAHEIAMSVGCSDERAFDFATAASEAAMNAVVHAGGGTAEVRRSADADCVQVWVQDGGNGITEEAIHKATLERGYTTGGGFGHGFWLMIRLVDRVYLLTGPGGTTVVLEQNREPPQPDWTNVDPTGQKEPVGPG